MPGLERVLDWFAGGNRQRGPARSNSVLNPYRQSNAGQSAAPRRASTGLSNLLLGRRTHPRVAPPDEAVYFDEGDGYLLVKNVGSGVDGSASLVRSVRNGKLYVRKENLNTEAWFGDSHAFRTQSPMEITNARAVRHVNGVYQAHGWTKWVEKDRGRFYNVTYWRYYNLGALHSFNTKFRRNGSPIPEEWCATWLVRMIQILIDIQEGGIIHHDCHGGNWLLETGVNGTPGIVLAYFGRSERRPSPSNFHSHHWDNACAADFSIALEAICRCLDLRYNASSPVVTPNVTSRTSPAIISICRDMATIVDRPQTFMSLLHDAIRPIFTRLQQLQSQYGRSFGTNPTIPRQLPIPEYMTGHNTILDQVVNHPDTYKQWRNAWISGNSINTTMQRGLIPSDNYNGVWWVQWGFGETAYTVDGRR